MQPKSIQLHFYESIFRTSYFMGRLFAELQLNIPAIMPVVVIYNAPVEK